MKWIIIVSGALTCTMLCAAIAPYAQLFAGYLIGMRRARSAA
jgi:hypothetical protein